MQCIYVYIYKYLCIYTLINNNKIFIYTRQVKKSETLVLKPAESTLTHTHIHTQ